MLLRVAPACRTPAAVIVNKTALQKTMSQQVIELFLFVCFFFSSPHKTCLSKPRTVFRVESYVSRGRRGRRQGLAATPGQGEPLQLLSFGTAQRHAAVSSLPQSHPSGKGGRIGGGVGWGTRAG